MNDYRMRHRRIPSATEQRSRRGGSDTCRTFVGLILVAGGRAARCAGHGSRKRWATVDLSSRRWCSDVEGPVHFVWRCAHGSRRASTTVHLLIPSAARSRVAEFTAFRRRGRSSDSAHDAAEHGTRPRLVSLISSPATPKVTMFRRAARVEEIAAVPFVKEGRHEITNVVWRRATDRHRRQRDYAGAATTKNGRS